MKGQNKRPAPSGNTPMPKVPRHLHLDNCFQEGMLEFDDPLWVLADLRPFRTEWGRVRGKEEERYGIDWKSKSK